MPLMEPYRIKVVEPIPILTRAEREAAMARAGYNPFNLRAEEITIDLLSDSGTGALSAAQQSAGMLGDESYAGARSFFRFREVVEDLTGYPSILPVHQGRAAERILFGAVLKPGQVSLSNTHFDTTRANVVLSGATAVDLPCAEAADLETPAPFKGDIDLGALAAHLDGDTPVGQVVMTITNNGGGGQPVSMANIAAAAELCRAAGVPFFLDAARFAENAWLVIQREPGWAGKTPREVARAAFDLADGAVASLKKDAIAHMGGFIALRDPDLAAQCELVLIATEGFRTYGGLSGRDLEMLAQGMREVVEPEYLAAREAATRHLGECVKAAGVSIVEPAGLHALYLNAGKLLPHLEPKHFPGHALATELYLAGGIRCAELGSLYLGEEDADGNLVTPAPHELVRLAIPRRVYTQSHLEYVAEVLAEIAKDPGSVPGYRVVEAPPLLRHFNCVVEPVKP
ncbi:tryptophanase [Actinokineospora bangkokensis]|uniref:Tyrosine phenol-lyase n=1 Tax=Actinokineospora bangkokensis TaxID=1193682 RepID=A0A1Q9LJ71_9PSEU|nr:tryptophanase [Actinokineospora bangkokensis]OLR92050.1 tyrosine phenol-lyase [Actinokineospora bangkokensis]